jgi:hypothetical protein
MRDGTVRLSVGPPPAVWEAFRLLILTRDYREPAER